MVLVLSEHSARCWQPRRTLWQALFNALGGVLILRDGELSLVDRREEINIPAFYGESWDHVPVTEQFLLLTNVYF